MLNHKSIVRLYAALENPPFLPTDFEVSNATGILTIRYKHERDYALILKPLDPDDYGWDLTYSPGEHLRESRAVLRDFSAIFEAIPEWLGNIHDNLHALPELRSIIDLEQQMKDVEARLADVPNRYATKEEAETIRAHIQEVEARLQAEIEKCRASDQARAAELEKMRQQLDFMQDQVNRFGLRQVLGMYMSRLWPIVTGTPLNNALDSGDKLIHMLTDGKG